MKDKHLSLILEHGCIVSILAAIWAAQPSAILLRYTIGVLPISCIVKTTKRDDDLILNKEDENSTKKGNYFHNIFRDLPLLFHIVLLTYCNEKQELRVVNNMKKI